MGNSHIHRIQWIDCAKTMAMTAVVVDHCYGILYTNIGVLWLSAYSVPLFVLLSGISAWNSSSVKAQVTGGGGGGGGGGPLLKQRGALGQFARATVLLEIYYRRFFGL